MTSPKARPIVSRGRVLNQVISQNPRTVLPLKIMSVASMGRTVPR